MATRDLVVKVTADTSGLKRGMADAGRQVGQTESKWKGTAEKAKGYAKVAAAAMAGLAVKWGADAVKLAGDTSESLSKVRTVFGTSSASVESFASKSAKSLGISRKSALDATGQFGNLFDQLGVGGKPAADMSTSMVKLAADLGSFNNADPTEVLESMQSAFRGEYDSLQKFIPTLSAATVEQEAMRMTGKKSAAQLTQQEKALATYAAMAKGAGKAQGDFSRTSGGLANQQRIAKARMEDLQGSIGAKLLPVITKLAGILNDVLLPAFTAVFSFIGKNMTWLGPLIAGIGALVVGIKAWAIAQAALNAVLAANPVVLIIAAIVALGVALVLAYQKCQTFRNIVQAAWRGVQLVAKIAFKAILIYLAPVILIVKAFWSVAKAMAPAVMGAFKKVASAAKSLAAGVRVAFGAVRSAASSVAGAVRATWSALAAFFSAVVGRVRAAMNAFGAALRRPVEVARAVAAQVRAAFGSMVSFVSGIVRQVASTASRMVAAVKGPINAVIRGINRVRLPSFSVNLDMPGPIPDIHWSSPSIDPFPNIPELAAGGVIRARAGGTLVRAGEAGHDEAVIPLGRAGLTGTVVNVTVNVAPTADPVRVGREVVRAIQSFERVSSASWRGA